MLESARLIRVHRDHDEAARLLGGYVSRAMRELQALSPADRRRQRRDRYRRIGAYREVAVADPTAMASGVDPPPTANGGGPAA